MESMSKLYMQRAEDEYLLSMSDMKISTEVSAKEIMGIPKDKTFYYSVISHAYYSIFYAAKAYLIQKGVETKSPEEHKKTYEAFKRFVESKELDRELLSIYDAEFSKAEVLLKIFDNEKRKRGMFTYNVLSEANIPYAEKSILNAKKFVSTIKKITE
jgi:uncharacterized protein (UPF0332 family)